MARLLGGQMSLGSWVCFCPCDVSFTRLLSQKLHFFTFSQIPFFLRPMKMPRISAFSASSEALQQSQPPWPQGPDSWNITLSRCVWGGGLGILQTHYIHCAFYFYYYYRIFQARVLAWVAISFSRGSSQPRDQTQVSHIIGRRFTLWAKSYYYINSTSNLQALDPRGCGPLCLGHSLASPPNHDSFHAPSPHFG